MPSTGNSRSTPPADHQLEVSVFGPGYGESIVVHLGLGDWLVVDSCKFVRSKSSAPLWYLQQLGVDVSNQVRLVIATHWHDDHIRGLAQMFAYARNARFVCSAAIRTHEFAHILDLADEAVRAFQEQSGSSMTRSGVAEITTIVRELQSRQPSMRPMYALGTRDIWHRTNPVSVVVRSLSPSDEDFEQTQKRLAQLITEMQDTVLAIPTLEPNDTSVAVSIIIRDNIGLLLGADLENGGKPTTGWQQVLTDWGSLDEKHHIFKVPHHGSSNGHNDRIWSELLHQSPIAALTPYSKLETPLPTDDDVARLKSLSNRVYLTALKRTKKLRLLDRGVERTIHEHTYSTTRYPSFQGQVRLRCDIDSPLRWDVQLFDDAVQL